ncbi:hypothetical protein [Chryseobacterium aurantiacum]|uniref:hypothetical protein n=1 Tax=Chryseobacterium aurantiacum TaxID=2116499 RepID=UPI000D11EDCE|nr:hypothetical protein [Chryseobacterium aurantiacum]
MQFLKKEKLFLWISMFFSITLYSQVGINTTQPNVTFEVVSQASNISKADGFIAPKLKGSELKAKDAVYSGPQTGTIIYITEALATNNTTPKTRNVVDTGYYYFNGNEWMRFNDLGRAPLMVTAFNGSGLADAGIVVPAGTSYKFPFPTVNIAADSAIATWDSLSNEFTVVKKGVYTIATSIRMENIETFGSASLIIHGGAQTGISGATAAGGGTGVPINNSFAMILEPGDKIWAEGFRAATTSSWSLGRRSINITFSEIK